MNNKVVAFEKRNLQGYREDGRINEFLDFSEQICLSIFNSETNMTNEINWFNENFERILKKISFLQNDSLFIRIFSSYIKDFSNINNMEDINDKAYVFIDTLVSFEEKIDIISELSFKNSLEEILSGFIEMEREKVA